MIVNFDHYVRIMPRGMREYSFGDSSVYIDSKSMTDRILFDKMRSRTREYAVTARRNGLYSESYEIPGATKCVRCGFSVTDCVSRIKYTSANMTVYMEAIRYLHCPLCGEPVPAGLASEEVKQECE